MKEINNNIKESYCSFEVSKLLMEKGFLNDSFYHYNQHGEFMENSVSNKMHVATHHLYANTYDFKIDRWGGGNSKCITAPTHALAIEWLKVNFGIWIYIKFDCACRKWYYIIQNTNNINEIDTRNNSIFNSPQEAIEAALKYVLEGLI